MSTACSRLLTLLALLLLGSAFASGTGGTSPINVDAFVPKADQWINSTFALIKEFKVFAGMRLIGTTIVFGFFIVGFLKHWPARNLAAIFRSLILSVLAVTLINDATKNTGVIGSLYTMPMTVWQKAYVSSTKAVKPKLDAGVIKDTRDLAITMNSFVSNAMMSVNAMGAFDGSQVTGDDPSAAASAAADQAITSVKNRAADETRILQSMSWIYQIGYLLLLGFFMAFAGVIYFSAMTIVFGMLALPVALGFWASGNGAGIKLIITSWLTAILTATLAPPIMMVATNTALKQPTAYIKSQIDPLNTQAKATMQQYASTYASCAAAHRDDWMFSGTATEVCSIGGNFSLFASSFGSAVMKVMVGLGIMIITMIVSLGVGAALIRAVPNILGSLLGGGVGHGGPEMSMARAASGMQQAARAMTTALTGGGAMLAGAARASIDAGIAGGRGAVAAGAVAGPVAGAVGRGARNMAESGLNAVRDSAVVNATTARRNEQTGVANAAREVAGLSPEKGTNAREVRAQLAAAGALPSQVAAAGKQRAAAENAAVIAADAGAARQYAAAFNAQEQNKAVTTPGYSPKTMTDQQAYSQMKAAGTLPSQSAGRGAAPGGPTYSAGNPMRPTAGEQARGDAMKQGYGQPYRDAKMNGNDPTSVRKENDTRAASQKARRDAGEEINGRGSVPAGGGSATPPPQKKAN